MSSVSATDSCAAIGYSDGSASVLQLKSGIEKKAVEMIIFYNLNLFWL